jgi:hypothetical protein
MSARHRSCHEAPYRKTRRSSLPPWTAPDDTCKRTSGSPCLRRKDRGLRRMRRICPFTCRACSTTTSAKLPPLNYRTTPLSTRPRKTCSPKWACGSPLPENNSLPITGPPWSRRRPGLQRALPPKAGGVSVEALLNYTQSVAFDPSQMETLSRLTTLSTTISGGTHSPADSGQP